MDRPRFEKVSGHSGWVAVPLLILLMSHPASASDIRGAASLRAGFDRDIAVDSPRNALVRRQGGRIVPDGVSGGALRLLPGEFVVLDSGAIDPYGGTIMFWFRPRWGYYERAGEDLVSHTFLSFPWRDGGYCVVSDGWWEPLGMYYSYFVQNNRNQVHARPKILYRTGQWTHLAVTWRTGTPGYVRFHADGELVGESFGNIAAEPAAGPVYIGCDRGSFLGNGRRWADGDIDELAIFPRPLSTAEIETVLDRQDPAWRERKFDWWKAWLGREYNPPRDGDGAIRETRAVFCEGPGEWATEAKSRALVARIRRAGFNVLVPCVWHGDGTRYPSEVAPPAKYKAPGDPLATLLRVAHANGIEVHPWFTVTYRSRNFLPRFRDSETAPDAFEIHRPEFRDFIVELVLDVVRRYEVDGINLDYIRSMGVTQGRYVAAAYREIYGRDLFRDSRAYDDRARMEPHLREFLDRAVEDVVRRVSVQGKTLRPGLVVSVDGRPIPRFLPPSDQGRQEVAWANAGLVDRIFSMQYERNPDGDEMDLIYKELDDPSKLLLLASDFDEVGRTPVSRDPAFLCDIIRFVQRKWNRGIGIYSYSMLTEAHVEALARGPFRDPARPGRPQRPAVPSGASGGTSRER